MANRGVGIDYTFNVGANVPTTTAQYRVIGGDVASQTSFAPVIPDTTTRNVYPLGIIQSYMSANSQQVTVRVAGISAVICGASVPAFGWVTADTQGAIRVVVQGTALTILTAQTAYLGIIGMPLENGSALQVVELVLRPWLSTSLLT